MKKNIIANFLECHSEEATVDRVLYLPLNTSHFNMAKIMAQQSKYESFIYFDGHPVTPSEETTGYRIIVNPVSLTALFPAFNKIVYFIPHINTNAPDIYKKIMKAALESSVALYEVPHGLFQTGYNLTDNASFIDIASYYDGIGINLPPVTKNRAKWYGDEGIGYPATIKKAMLKKRILPDFTLISSNTNWYLYSMADKRNFYNYVFSFAEKNADKMFIWSPHPAELNGDTYTAALRHYLPENIYLYGMDNDIYFHGINCTDDLIPYCECAISTVSTCLLDYEIYHKGVNVFSCAGTERITQNLTEAEFFDNEQQLTLEPKKLITGYLKEYSPELFDKFLSKPADPIRPGSFRFSSLF